MLHSTSHVLILSHSCFDIPDLCDLSARVDNATSRQYQTRCSGRFDGRAKDISTSGDHRSMSMPRSQQRVFRTHIQLQQAKGKLLRLVATGSMHRPGIEPGAGRHLRSEDLGWQRPILPLNHQCLMTKLDKCKLSYGNCKGRRRSEYRNRPAAKCRRLGGREGGRVLQRTLSILHFGVG